MAHLYRLTGVVAGVPDLYVSSGLNTVGMQRLISYLIFQFEPLGKDSRLGTEEIAELLTAFYGAEQIIHPLSVQNAVEIDVIDIYLDFEHEREKILAEPAFVRHGLYEKLNELNERSSRDARRHLKHLYQGERLPFAFEIKVPGKTIALNTFLLLLLVAFFEVMFLLAEEDLLLIRLFLYGIIAIAAALTLLLYHVKDIAPLRMLFTDQAIEIGYLFKTRRWDVHRLEFIELRTCLRQRYKKYGEGRWEYINKLVLWFGDEDRLEITAEHLRYMPIRLDELYEQLVQLYSVNAHSSSSVNNS